jgi:hypothetical protein
VDHCLVHQRHHQLLDGYKYLEKLQEKQDAVIAGRRIQEKVPKPKLQKEYTRAAEAIKYIKKTDCKSQQGVNPVRLALRSSSIYLLNQGLNCK